MTARKRHADVAWTQLPLPTLRHNATWTATNQQAQADAPATVSTAPTLDAAGRRRFERDQPLPAADELAALMRQQIKGKAGDALPRRCRGLRPPRATAQRSACIA